MPKMYIGRYSPYRMLHSYYTFLTQIGARLWLTQRNPRWV